MSQIDGWYLFGYLRGNLDFTLSQKSLKNQANSHRVVRFAGGQKATHVNDYYNIC